MAETRAFDSEMERIGNVLRVTREAFEPSVLMLAEAAESLTLPEEEKLAIAAERFQAGAPERQAVEVALAQHVAGLAAEIAHRTREFDTRDVPTRPEKLIGLISRRAMGRCQRARLRRSGSLDHLTELLRRADRLADFLCAERETLLGERRKSENKLVAFIDHRPNIAERLRGASGEVTTGVEAARRTGYFVEIFQMFIDEFNARVGACNVMLHKLLVDVEDLLILYQVSSEFISRPGDEGLKIEDFPRLAPEIERFSKGMLSVHGLDRRRARANQAFAERFPAVAAREAAAEAHPARKGWRFGSLSGVKIVRP